VKVSKELRFIALLALFAALLSFAKFSHCRNFGWGSPDVYIHMCYSDLSALYGARDINQDIWPYSSKENAVEYPVLTGVVMWATGLAINDANGYRAYFDLNSLLIALLFIGAAILAWRIRPDFAYLFPVAPAVIGSLYINWDLWAVASALLAIYLFKKEKLDLSALLLGISIAIKFFPVVILFGIGLILKSEKKTQKLIRYFAITAATWLAFNLPVALTNGTGWWRFFKLNIERGNDLGSFWYAISLLGLTKSGLGNVSVALFLLGAIGISFFYLKVAKNRSSFENFTTIAFLFVALFVTASKVYSPQYILWLTPLAVIAMTKREERSAFWVWQAGEAMYHFAVWQYLASYSGAKFGLPEKIYAIFILIRIATLIWFAARLIQTAKEANGRLEGNTQASGTGFLTDSARGYS